MKTAVVLEGGASRALFGAGVTDVLLSHGIYADITVGSSAGIANGVSYVSRQKGRALDMAMTYTADKRYMGIRHLLNPKNRSYYNIPFVFEEIPNSLNVFDFDTFGSCGSEAYACLTNMNTAQAEYKRVEPTDKAFATLVATCALPLLFQPVVIDGVPYMDGGIADSVPVDFALSSGCERVLCVLTRERDYRKSEKDASLSVAAAVYRKYPRFAELLKRRNALYNETREHLFDLEKQGKIMLITPEDTKGFSRTEKAPDRLAAIHAQGVSIAEANIDRIKEYLS